MMGCGKGIREKASCLNPYCNGCTSMIAICIVPGKRRTRLNPYCNGCTSMITEDSLKTLLKRVSILIVMDVLQ